MAIMAASVASDLSVVKHVLCCSHDRLSRITLDPWTDRVIDGMKSITHEETAAAAADAVSIEDVKHLIEGL